MNNEDEQRVKLMVEQPTVEEASLGREQRSLGSEKPIVHDHSVWGPFVRKMPELEEMIRPWNERAIHHILNTTVVILFAIFAVETIISFTMFSWKLLGH